MKVERFCLNCSKPFITETKYIKRGHGKYCSRICSLSKPRKRKEKEPNIQCETCGTKFYRVTSKQKNSKSGLMFCNRTCKEEAQKIGGIKSIQPPHYGTLGLGSYRKLAFRLNKHICIGCGYAKHSSVLEVHHLDGNHCNNIGNNLALLCPTCHTECHKGLRKLVDRAGSAPAEETLQEFPVP